MNALLKRSITGLIYAVLFVGAICSGQLVEGLPQLGFCFAAFLTVVLVGCTYELFKMISVLGANPMKWMGYLFAVVLMSVSVYAVCCNDQFSFISSIWLLGAMFAISFPLLLIVQLWRKSESPICDAVYTMLPMMYFGVPLSLMFVLQQSTPDGWLMVLLMVLMVWTNDSFAYVGGSLFGRHKMWERVSPKKTWEGTVSGVVCTVVMTALLGNWLMPQESLLFWPVVGLLGSVLATLGDLVESMIKRSAGVKDSGNVLPGHGGFLDRFDSLLIVTPFYFFVMLYLL